MHTTMPPDSRNDDDRWYRRRDADSVEEEERKRKKGEEEKECVMLRWLGSSGESRRISVPMGHRINNNKNTIVYCWKGRE